MKLSRTLTPVEALRTVTERCQGAPVARLPVAAAAGVYLAETIDVSPCPSREKGTRWATRNGYALPPDFTGGRCRFRSRHVDHGEVGPSRGSMDGEEDSSRLTLERLETGDPLPPGTDRVLPVDAVTVVGTGIIDVDSGRVPPAGAGVERGEESRRILEAGTALTPRLQALLLAGGVREIRARPTWKVGIATVGSDLRDVETPPPPPPAASTADQNGFWLAGAVRALGLEPHPLGAVGDEAREIRTLFRHAERIGLATFLLSGGLGDGIADRTVEALRSGPFRIFFEGVTLEPGRRFLFAQGHGLDLFALGGAPLDAAVAFDLFVAPALLRARGAPPQVWDWMRNAAALASPTASGETWTVWPLGATASSDPVTGTDGAGDGDTAWRSPRVPGLPAQWGWEIRPPGDGGSRQAYRARRRG